jgi:hypothetical protein
MHTVDNRNEISSQQLIDRIEDLVHRAETLSDSQARDVTVELLRAVLDFHKAGLQRAIAIAGEAIVKQIAQDDLASSMLLLHDLHPDNVQTRIDRAVFKLQEAIALSGAKLRLIAIEVGTVHLHFESPRSWPRFSVRSKIENAIFEIAPEIERVLIEGLKEAPPVDFVPVSDLLAGSER